MNKTECLTFSDSHCACYAPKNVPFYHTDRPSIVPGIPDYLLALAAPIIGYWSLSLVFHALDISGWQWLEKYRIHESAEVKSRNLATRTEVVRAVLLQQAIQTMLGLVWVTEDAYTRPGNWRGGMEDVGVVLVGVVRTVLGKEMGGQVLQTKGADMVYFLYWWAIPIAQFCFAMCIYLCHVFICNLTHVGILTGSSSTHGSTFCTGSCTPTNSSTNTFIRSITDFTSHMHTVHYITTPSKVSCSIR